MTVDEFKEIFEEIETVHKFNKELNDVHYKYSLNAPDTLTLEDIVIRLLSAIFNEPEDTFEFFIYDMNFGTKYKHGDFKVNGKNIDISSIEKFYDYLISDSN